MTYPAHRLSVAPMMDWTDRHCRAFHRSLTRRAMLYTEMVTADAVIHGDRSRLLAHDPEVGPVALQLGGSDPSALAAAAQAALPFGYDEINLNVGCPSDRVQSGRFGACLMREPQLVADCMAAMAEAVPLPVTVKCRIGVDDQVPEQALFALVDACVAAGVSHFVVHARMAWLKGLSPKENRDIPPLDYALVRRLKRERPELTVVLNGGVPSVEAARDLLVPEDGVALDGVMLGRTAYHEPAGLGRVDPLIFGADGDTSAEAALEAYRPYMAARLEEGVHLPAMARHMLGLMHGRPGARTWRRILTVDSLAPGAGLEVLDRALEAVHEAEARAAARLESAA
ncbi:tRNA dihydrouridine(20/20a) synthase DusA [Brevundimonas poindexterae]|uniref:tRNA dihydrouridine(20/20a) synthase DusA n=1 Tax=Brevundimonas poindexterae TaxID=74325 RepID=UPI001CFDD74E|nr:tRNA dihydrouridine(20/20a) synthase DusA [Brevundimonas poindexterae]